MKIKQKTEKIKNKNKEVMVNPTDEETNTSRIRDLTQEGT